MQSGQRDLNNRSPKRRLSIGYKELEALHESIRVSVLNEIKAEMEKSPDQEFLKTSILSDIRDELVGLPNPASFKASILNELRMELGYFSGKGSSGVELKLKEMKVLHDGLLRELLDQKTVVTKLEARVKQLSEKLEKLESKAPASVSTPIPPSLFDDPLDLPPLSRRPKQRVDIKKKAPLAREHIEVREVPAPLPGTSTKLELKVEDEFPEDAAAEEAAASRCEYIIAESGELKARNVPNQEEADKYECEYIIAERPAKKAKKAETVVHRDEEDVEIITCSRQILNTQ